jgi:hypothetical protein
MPELQLLADRIQQEWDFAIQYGITQKEVKDYIKNNLNPI